MRDQLLGEIVTQLVSASKELKDAVSGLDQHKLQAFGIKHKI